MKLVKTKGRNSAVKLTTNGVAKPGTPDAPPVLNMKQLKADMSDCRLGDFEAIVQEHPGCRFVVVPFDDAEYRDLRLAAGQSAEGNIPDFIKEWALTASRDAIDELGVALRDKKAKIVWVK